MNVTFDAGGGNSIEITGPVSNQPVDPFPQYVSGLSAGGTRWSYKVSTSSLTTWALTFDGMSASEKSALDTFFWTHAEGPTNTFTYTHTDGNSYTARFVNNRLQWQRKNGAEWSVNVHLEISGSVS